MKITVIGSHLCPDTLFALNKLKEINADIDFLDISSSLPDLKAYLSVREKSPLYNTVRENGGIGIPYFCMEDGTETLDISTVLKKID